MRKPLQLAAPRLRAAAAGAAWRTLLLWPALLGSAASTAQVDSERSMAELNRVVAVVNDDVIVDSQLSRRLQVIRAQLYQSGTQPPPDEVLRGQVLERLVLEHQLSRFPVSLALRALVVVALWIPLPAAVGAAFVYGAFQDSLPPTPYILEPPPGSSTQVTLLDGRPVGGLHRGLSPWVRYRDIPPLVVEAFLAAEDDEFFLHAGVDLRAIVRAAPRAAAAGSSSARATFRDVAS